MNLKDYIQEYLNQLPKNKTFKKWLELPSSPFFSSQISFDICEFSIQRKIAKLALAEYKETGNFLIYLSSNYYLQSKEALLPIFLKPIIPKIDLASKNITWNIIEEDWIVNSELIHTYEVVPTDLLTTWIQEHKTELPNFQIIESQEAIYFNQNTKKFILNDLLKINHLEVLNPLLEVNNNLEWNRDIEHELPEFNELKHVLMMDSSQAKAIWNALSQSMVISGPPGTGKSQTIVNLALNELIKGKKVAILSEKKAALDVINHRLIQLNLDFVFAHNDSPKAYFKDIENTLDLLTTKQLNTDIQEDPSIRIIHHNISILNQYYNAHQTFNQSEIIKDSSQAELHEKIHQNPNKNHYLMWFYPDVSLANVSLENLKDKYNQLYQNLKKLSIDWNDETFSLIEELKNKFELLANLDYEAYALWKKGGKRAKSKLDKLYKELKIKQNELNSKTRFLIGFSEYEIQYSIDKTKNLKITTQWFDKSYKDINTRIKSKIRDWEIIPKDKKIEILNSELELLDIQKKIESLASEIETLKTKENWNSELPVYEYIENKIQSNIPLWEFINKHWIQSKKLIKHLSLWKEIFEIYEELSKYHLNQEGHIQNMISQGKLKDWDSGQEVWRWLCLNQKLTPIHWFQWSNSYGKGWSEFIQQEKNVQKPSILKNYSYKEIAKIGLQTRRMLQNYNQTSLNQWKDEYIAQKQSIWNEKLSRAKSNLETRKKWIQSGKWVKRNWSEKKKKLSSLEYQKELDSEFLLWLKPLIISTLEQFSLSYPLEMEMIDVVIFDESSQIELIHAIPAIYRAKKIIVVGDRKQLQPTRFFQTTNFSNHHYENLLEFGEQNFPKIQLNHHYRSQSKELIGFSNQYFYENTLFSTRKSNPQSIQFHKIKHGIYFQRKNTKEAEAIINFLKENQENFKNKSIGIVSFSIQQKEEIEYQLEKKSKEDSSFDDFITKKQEENEYFFVKNIENVQGDERDVILISVGYAPNPEGKFYQFFGPILSAQGENRLNVLMSRAKYELHLFSSISSKDIQVKTTSSRGLKIFQAMIAWMEDAHSKQHDENPQHQNYWEYFLNPFRN